MSSFVERSLSAGRLHGALTDSISFVCYTATSCVSPLAAKQTQPTLYKHVLILVALRLSILIMAAVRESPFDWLFASLSETEAYPGLQSPSAQFSWKVVFENGYQLFEIVMSACSSKEEVEWRSRLDNAMNRSLGFDSSHSLPSPVLNLQSLGVAFGRSGKFIRRLALIFE